MKKRKILLTLLALILCLCLLLQGCAITLVMEDMEHLMEALEQEDSSQRREEPTEEDEEKNPPETEPKPTEQTEPTQPSEPEGHVSYEDYERPEESYLEPIPFDEISYERPDAQNLCDRFNEIQSMVEAEEPVSEIIDAFDLLYADYVYFYTLSDYAYIRYTLNLDDPYFDEEYNWCEEQSPLIEQAMEECYIAMADSNLRTDLESQYFGEGFFEYYDENQVYSNDRVVELMQEESALQSEYMALQNEMTIRWKGEDRLVDELFSDPYLSYEDYMEIYRLYYEKYNPLASDIFVELVRVRKELARELEYESYAHFAYEYYYYRDYTPEQVAQYTDDIAVHLAPYYYTAVYGSYSDYMDSETVMETLGDVAYSFGGEIATAYDYMMAYGLYDISSSPSKMPGSYMTYLSSYGMPYMYVSPTEDISDVLTAVHEFGHFVDGYVNCNYTSSIDCAEVFSQGLEFLSLNKIGLNRSEEEALTVSKLSDSLLVFLGQGCYAEFEQRVYELPDEELTAENINALFLECNEKFGMGMYGYEDIIAPGWIDIQHFFIAPYYVISYCVSNDAALQIYQRELADGSGLEAYRDLLHLSADNTILAMLEEAGMDSPFDAGRMETLAEFFDENLY